MVIIIDRMTDNKPPGPFHTPTGSRSRSRLQIEDPTDDSDFNDTLQTKAREEAYKLKPEYMSLTSLSSFPHESSDSEAEIYSTRGRERIIRRVYSNEINHECGKRKAKTQEKSLPIVPVEKAIDHEDDCGQTVECPESMACKDCNATNFQCDSEVISRECQDSVLPVNRKEILKKASLGQIPQARHCPSKHRAKYVSKPVFRNISVQCVTQKVGPDSAAPEEETCPTNPIPSKSVKFVCTSTNTSTNDVAGSCTSQNVRKQTSSVKTQTSCGSHWEAGQKACQVEKVTIVQKNTPCSTKLEICCDNCVTICKKLVDTGTTTVTENMKTAETQTNPSCCEGTAWRKRQTDLVTDAFHTFIDVVRQLGTCENTNNECCGSTEKVIKPSVHEMNVAATKIQSCVRGFLARKNYSKTYTSESEIEDKQPIADFFLLFGGSSSFTSLPEIKSRIGKYVYGLQNNSSEWTIVDCLLPEPRTHGGVVMIGNLIYIFGGNDPRFTEGANLAISKKMWSYNLNTYKWTRLPSMRTARSNFGCVIFEGDIFVFGGIGIHGQALPTCERYSPIKNQWKDVCPMSSPVYSMGISVLGESIVIAGGIGGDRNNNYISDEVNSFEPHKNVWKSVAPLPFFCCYTSLVTVQNSNLYLVGGCVADYPNDTEGTSTDIILKYDFDNALWKNAGKLLKPRHGHCVIHLGKQIIVAGGVSSCQVLKSVEMYDFSLRESIQMSNLPTPLFGTMSIRVP